jgi:hypothetical protein
MFKAVTSAAILIAITFITSNQTDAQIVFPKSSRGSYGQTERSTQRSPDNFRPQTNGSRPSVPMCGNDPRFFGSGDTGQPKGSPNPAPTRDTRLVGKWTIKGNDGTITKLNFTKTSVSMVKTDGWGEVIRDTRFKWKATMSESSNSQFTFKLKHASGTIETYKGKIKADGSKCKLVTESGETMILQKVNFGTFGGVI